MFGEVGGRLNAIRHDYANFNWIMTGRDTFAREGTGYDEHEDGAWRAGVTHAGRWCGAFEVRLPHPALLHPLRPRLRRARHGPLSVAHGRRPRRERPARLTVSAAA
jgi:hypothetical protein